MNNLKYATNEDYIRINNYFKDSGIVYDNSDKIFIFEDKQKAIEYLMQYDATYISSFLLKNTQSYDYENLLDFIIDNLDCIWYDYEYGKIYIIS